MAGTLAARPPRPRWRCAAHALTTLAALLGSRPAAAAQWKPQQSGTTTELRGLAAVNEAVAWAAGRDGIYTRTTDGGSSWTSASVPGAADLYFIDVHAVSADTAFLLGTDFRGSYGAVYKTTDGGAHWVRQYQKRAPGVFFDGMAFWDADHGVAFSDPVDGSFLIVTTADGGATWTEVPRDRIPPPRAREAGFAASGSGIVVQGSSRAWFGTGGSAMARVFFTLDGGATWAAAETPLAASQTAGIFALAFRDSLNGVAGGGDYRDSAGTAAARLAGGANVLRTADSGITWALASPSDPPGVRYGLAYVPGAATPTLMAVGPAGSGYSLDDGTTWTRLGDVGYNTVSFASPAAGWAAGTGGRIARWTGPIPPAVTP
ncbi:MAG: oxidoreductase [Gemmatimonadetes bacterium]|nr:oxidoreductase [Gemmatimonadota bacterium]